VNLFTLIQHNAAFEIAKSLTPDDAILFAMACRAEGNAIVDFLQFAFGYDCADIDRANGLMTAAQFLETNHPLLQTVETTA
jgi:hypothetical protein